MVSSTSDFASSGFPRLSKTALPSCPLAKLFGLTYLMIRQDRGDFRCKSITVYFSDEVWEEAWIKKEDGSHEQRLLIYSHFNGMFSHPGRMCKPTGF